MCCMYTVYSGMQEWVIQIPSIPILVSVLFPSLHLKYFRIKFLLLVYIVDKQSEYGKQKDRQNFSLDQICDSKFSWNIKQFTAVLAKKFPSMAPEFLLYNYEHHHKGSCIGTMKTGHGPHMTWHTGARHPLAGICNG